MLINTTAYRSIITDHYLRYPLMQAADLYKLIHQGAMGSEHAVIDINRVRQWLEKEIAGLLPGPSDPMFDPISDNGEIIRVHLRPYLAQGGDLNQLVEAFVQTASLYKGCPEKLNHYWTCAREMAETGELKFNPLDLGAFFVQMKTSDFPAVHHSEKYRQTYQPAYRVVLRELIQQIHPT